MDKVFRPCVRKLAIAGETEIQPASNEVAACRRPRLRFLMAAAGAEVAGPADAAVRLGVHMTLHQEREAPIGVERGGRSQAIVVIADGAVAGVPVTVGRDGKIAAACATRIGRTG